MASVQDIIGPRNGASPLEVPIVETGLVNIESAFASFDGSGASGDFRPALTIRAQDGTILSRTFPSDSLAAGDSADVTYAPFLRANGATTTVSVETKIFDATLAAQSTFDVSGIPGTYNDLLLILMVRSARTGTTLDTLRLRLNNDSGNNYGVQRINASGTAVGASEESTQPHMWVGNMATTASPAGIFQFIRIYLPGYASTSWKKPAWVNNNNSSNITSSLKPMNIFNGLWNSTAAIDRITLFGGAVANLEVGSQLRIYGVL